MYGYCPYGGGYGWFSSGGGYNGYGYGANWYSSWGWHG
jgi:hypothetical protein